MLLLWRAEGNVLYHQVFNYLSFGFNVLFHSVSITNIYWLFMEEHVFILFWQFLIFDFGDTEQTRGFKQTEKERETSVNVRSSMMMSELWWLQMCLNRKSCYLHFLFGFHFPCSSDVFTCVCSHACVCSWLWLALWTETGFVFSCASGQVQVPVPGFSQE